MQLDIGFDDVITPGPTDIEYPTLLDFPPPVLRAYPKQTVVAEKLEALYSFEGRDLAEAIIATFRHRGTAIEAEPIGLTQAYCDDPARVVQWRAFVRRSRFEEDARSLARLLDEIRLSALPVLCTLATAHAFTDSWKPGGPWQVRN